MRRRCDLEQGPERRLITEVGEYADDVKTELFGELAQVAILGGLAVTAQPDAKPRRPHVSASVGILLRRMRSIRITSLSSGSGQATSESFSSQSLAGCLRCLAASSGSAAAMANMQKKRPSGIRTRLESVTSK